MEYKPLTKEEKKQVKKAVSYIKKATEILDTMIAAQLWQEEAFDFDILDEIYRFSPDMMDYHICYRSSAGTWLKLQEHVDPHKDIPLGKVMPLIFDYIDQHNGEKAQFDRWLTSHLAGELLDKQRKLKELTEKESVVKTKE